MLNRICEAIRQPVLAMETLRPSDLQEFYKLAEADRVGLSLLEFEQALELVAQRCLVDTATRSQRVAFYKELHLKDLALAQSCSRGNAIGWEHFSQRFQSRLYAAALTLARDEETARDLADSTSGEIFINDGAGGGLGSSRVASYTGRGSLEGWLKALLTNSYIDRHRSQRRMISLEERIDIVKSLCIGQEASRRTASDSRLRLAIEQALSQRSPEERYLLTAYFFDRRTLKEISIALGIHESSVSRRLDRLLRQLRRGINRNLQKAGLSSAEIKDLLRAEDWSPPIDWRALLTDGLAQE